MPLRTQTSKSHGFGETEHQEQLFHFDFMVFLFNLNPKEKILKSSVLFRGRDKTSQGKMLYLNYHALLSSESLCSEANKLRKSKNGVGNQL